MGHSGMVIGCYKVIYSAAGYSFWPTMGHSGMVIRCYKLIYSAAGYSVLPRSRWEDRSVQGGDPDHLQAAAHAGGHPAPPRPAVHHQNHLQKQVEHAHQRRGRHHTKACSLFSWAQREREMFYLTTHSTHFIYGYMVSDIWLRTILIVRKETRCHHIGYSFRLTARVILYAPSHRQDNTYHSLCYTSRGALPGTRNSSMGPPHEGSIRRHIAPWVNALPLSYVPLSSTCF